MTKAELLRAAEAWWMTGNVWEFAGFSRKADDRRMWECLMALAGMPI